MLDRILKGLIMKMLNLLVCFGCRVKEMARTERPRMNMKKIWNLLSKSYVRI